MANIKDIAKYCEVSVGTVSKALNDDFGKNSRVGKETRARIKKAARAMGYITDDMARSIRTGKSKTIAYIYSMIDYETLFGMLETANQHQYTVDPVYFDENDPESVAKTVHYIRTQRLAAVSINISNPSTIPLIEGLKELNIPLVFGSFLSHNAAKGILEVDTDTALAMQLIADRLAGMGHRDLLYVGGDVEVENYRYEILRDYLDSKHTGVKLRRVILHSYSKDEFQNQIFTAYKSCMPTAAVCSHRDAANLLFCHIAEQQLKVPDDISMISFGDSYINSRLDISCIKEKAYEMGGYVSERLIKMIKDKSSNKTAQKLFDVDLIIRGSVKEITYNQ